MNEKKNESINLNCLQYSKLQTPIISNEYSMSVLEDNLAFEALLQNYKTKFNFKKLKTFALSKEGFLGLFLELRGKIAISVGETQAVIDGAKLYENLGFELLWLELNKDGKVDVSALKNTTIDFLFLSSYVMDTFVKTNLEEVKTYTNAKIISNVSAHFDLNSDIIYFDNYKLTGFNISGVILFNDDSLTLLPIGEIDTIACKFAFEALEQQHFNTKLKSKFQEKLITQFKDDLYFFVNPNDTLEQSLHFGLKDIKARELIRTLALSQIYITNGEGCSLGLSKPSRVIQAMGYDETTSRNAISLSFMDEMSDDTIDKVIKMIYMKYKQIRSFL
ncbi:MAG: cysteine desulfurase [Arcobacteraceae bacterium]